MYDWRFIHDTYFVEQWMFEIVSLIIINVIWNVYVLFGKLSARYNEKMKERKLI